MEVLAAENAARKSTQSPPCEMARKSDMAEREARKSEVTEFASGACPNGHPEQARAWTLYGETPFQCPRRGETPRF